MTMDLEEIRHEIHLMTELEHRGHSYGVMDYTLVKDEDIDEGLTRIFEDISQFCEGQNVRILVIAS